MLGAWREQREEQWLNQVAGCCWLEERKRVAGASWKKRKKGCWCWQNKKNE